MVEFKCPLHEAGDISKGEEGLICSDGTLSFYEYNQLVSLAADRLLHAGVVSGDHVGLLLSPGWRGPVLLLALIRIGAVACFFDPALNKAGIMERLIRISGRHLIVSEDLGIESPGHDVTVLKAEQLARMGGIDERIGIKEKIPGDRHSTLVFDAGPDGEIRVILNTYANHYYSALGCNANFDLRSHDKWMLTMPLSKQEGISIVFRAVLSAGTLVVPGPRESLVDAIEEYGITHLSLEPAEVESLFDGSKKPADTLKLIVVDGEVNPETLARAGKQNVRVCSCYSLPEMASVVTSMHKTSGPDKQGTRGGALKYCDVRVDSSGRIQVRGQTLFAGYWKDGKIERGLTEDGWFVTDHSGVMDSDGYLKVNPHCVKLPIPSHDAVGE